MRPYSKSLPDAPFVGYRVTFAGENAQHTLQVIASAIPTIKARKCLLACARPISLSTTAAGVLYDAVERAARHVGVPFPLRFVPIRCKRGRALPFESVALGAAEILHLVHDGFFNAARGREAAIAAVEACGALPVPVVELAPVRRGASRPAAQRHVETLIDRECQLRTSPAGVPRGPVA